MLQQQLAVFLKGRTSLLQRRADPVAMRTALSEIALLALESTIDDRVGARSSWLSGVNPVAFRRACVTGAARSAGGDGSVVEAISNLIISGSRSDDGDHPLRHRERETRALALQALEAIATDDPSTPLDNDHALSICATGVVPPLVALLASPHEELHIRAAATTAALAENKQCAKMLLGAGCVPSLLSLGRYGAIEARRYALRALRILAIDADARERIAARDTDGLVAGLARHGPGSLRAAARELQATLATKVSAAVDGRGYAQQARQTRIGQSKVLSREGGVREM